jgi:hypothetical protein
MAEIAAPLAGVAMATKFTGDETVAPFTGAQTTTPADEGAAHALLVPPVPLSETVCGLPLAESVTVIAPVRVPVVEGANVTETLQLAPAFNELGQALVCAKSPLAAMLLMLSDAPPLFVSVTFCAPLVVPTF